MGLFDLLKEETKVEEPQKEEIKEAEIVEDQPAEEPKKAAKKTAKPKVKTKSEKEGFLYPFSIYTEGRLIDTDNYGFEEGKTYKESDITKIMLAHKHYEFSGTMEYSFIEDDNVVVVNGKQHKKG